MAAIESVCPSSGSGFHGFCCGFMVVHISLWWFAVGFHGGFVVILWWFVVVHGGFSPKMSRKKSCDPLLDQLQTQNHYEISFLMRFLICPFPFKEHCSIELC